VRVAVAKTFFERLSRADKPFEQILELGLQVLRKRSLRTVEELEVDAAEALQAITKRRTPETIQALVLARGELEHRRARDAWELPDFEGGEVETIEVEACEGLEVETASMAEAAGVLANVLRCKALAMGLDILDRERG
jgi:hypothetical protein